MFDVAVGHSGDVVGDGAGEALGGDLRLVVVRQLSGVGDERGEHSFDDLGGVGASLLHAGGVVEMRVEEFLGGGAGGFDLRAEGCQAARRVADTSECSGAETGCAGAHFGQQISYQEIQYALEGFVRAELGRGGGIFAEHGVMEIAKEGHACADLLEGENAGFKAVVEIGGEVGDLVGQIDQLRFKGRELVEEVFGQLGVRGGGVVVGVLDDAFPDSQGQVEAAKSGVALLKPGDDAQGVQVVIEAEAEGANAVVQGFFAGVTEGRVAYVVGQGQGFSEFGIEAESAGEGAGDLGDLQGVGEAAAEMVRRGIAGQAGEDLGLAGQAAEGARVEDAGGVAGEGRAIGMRGLGVRATGQGDVRVSANGYAWG